VRNRLRIVLRGLASLGATSLIVLAGCSDQGEGERCGLFGGTDATVNGTSDCASGLVCVTPPNANAVTQLSTLGVCCPPAGIAATTAACQNTLGGSTMGGPPKGDGSFDGGAHDANVDARPTDAAQDAAPDTGHDSGGIVDSGAADAPHDAPHAG
jgi:hypothetical protein